MDRYLADSPTSSEKSDKDSLQSIDYEMLGFRKGQACCIQSFFHDEQLSNCSTYWVGWDL